MVFGFGKKKEKMDEVPPKEVEVPEPVKEKVPGVTVGATVSSIESGTKAYMDLYPEKATDGGKLCLSLVYEKTNTWLCNSLDQRQQIESMYPICMCNSL